MEAKSVTSEIPGISKGLKDLALLPGLWRDGLLLPFAIILALPCVVLMFVVLVSVFFNVLITANYPELLGVWRHIN